MQDKQHQNPLTISVPYLKMNIFWQEMDGTLQMDFPDHIQDQNGTLHFNQVQAEDKGRYTCVASNSQGVINVTIDIDVVGKYH